MWKGREGGEWFCVCLPFLVSFFLTVRLAGMDGRLVLLCAVRGCGCGCVTEGARARSQVIK